MSNIPFATYRIQLNPAFAFHQCERIVSYLADLGISHIYASPIFKTRKGSMHGYDVVDPNSLNPELGSKAEFDRLAQTIRDHRMGWLQDFVPNHMAYDSQNAMLMDVLENGPNSAFFDFFDVQWDHPYASLKRKILAPFLGKFYSECLENGELQLKYQKNGLVICYYEHCFPIRLDSYLKVLNRDIGKLRAKLSATHPDYVKLLGVFYTLRSITQTEDEQERYEQIVFAKGMLWELYNGNEHIKAFFDANISGMNGDVNSSASFNMLDELLSEQHFRLSFWKVGTEEINYRRFFNINGLISLKMENEQVFRKIHEFLANLVKEKKIHGLRVDHVDGLFLPTLYLKRLAEKFSELYIVVEKILDMNEKLPEFWPVQGTTGYDFANFVNGLFIKKENKYKFGKIYRRFTGRDESLEEIIHCKKKLIMEKHMAGDLDNLARLLAQIASQTRYGNDFTLFGLRRALVEVLALFPVYRTYVSQQHFREADQIVIENTIKKAKENLPDFANELNFLNDLLLLNFSDNLSKERQDEWMHFVLRLQQMSGPLMAKGFEDTALYNYFNFLSLNEVGGNPGKFGVSAIEFHYYCKNRAAQWPHSMNATSTHDTKRGEDVRARLNVLSEMPEAWANKVNLWYRLNRKHKTQKNKHEMPDKNDEYFLYQTLIGSLPFFEQDYEDYASRMKEYVIKAVREAKVHTAWLKPDSEYEGAFVHFIEKVLDFTGENPFLREFMPFQQKIAFYGMLNSLAQVLIKTTAPGIPDFYQGTEFWDLSLVDPDNRRPVDFAIRQECLQLIKQEEEKDVSSLFDDLFKKQEGGAKLYIIHKCLEMRKKYEQVFLQGSYVPVEADGKLRAHVFSFARNYGDDWIVAVVPKFLTGIVPEGQLPLGEAVWQNTQLYLPVKNMTWENVFPRQSLKIDETIPLSQLMAKFPVALLCSQ